jgi:hypothetical protein
MVRVQWGSIAHESGAPRCSGSALSNIVIHPDRENPKERQSKPLWREIVVTLTISLQHFHNSRADSCQSKTRAGRKRPEIQKHSTAIPVLAGIAAGGGDEMRKLQILFAVAALAGCGSLQAAAGADSLEPPRQPPSQTPTALSSTSSSRTCTAATPPHPSSQAMPTT